MTSHFPAPPPVHTLEAGGDDTLHVNATVICLRAKLAADRVRLERGDLRPGDRLQFWDMARARLAGKPLLSAAPDFTEVRTAP